MIGRITFWDQDRQIGLIRPDDIREGDLTLTRAMLIANKIAAAPVVGDRFEFSVRANKDGRIEPDSIKPLDPKRAAELAYASFSKEEAASECVALIDIVEKQHACIEAAREANEKIASFAAIAVEQARLKHETLKNAADLVARGEFETALGYLNVSVAIGVVELPPEIAAAAKGHQNADAG